MLDATSYSLAGLCFCLLAISAAALTSFTIFCCTSIVTVLLYLSATAAIWMSALCSLLISFTSQARRRETAQETWAT